MSTNSTQHGYLVIADISGYTSYVAKTELDHAQAILAELLEAIVSSLTTLLTLSKLEGDAVFGYVPESRVARSETILELVESTYVSFKDHVLNMNRHTTCSCNACLNIPLLDLKFIVHHGDYFRQQIAGLNEMVGSDVNLVHRLLKNSVAEATHWHAYALFTEAALAHMGIRLDAEGAYTSTEHYEHLGDVQAHSFNLRERYQALSEARRVVIAEKDADVKYIIHVAAPPAVVWTWLNDPQKRNVCAVSELHWRAEQRADGRTGVGARNHCAHGGGEITETILDWRPFDYYTALQADPKMSRLSIFSMSQLEPVAQGRATIFHHYFHVDIKGLPRWLSRRICIFMMQKSKVRETYERMAQMAAEEYRAQQLSEGHESGDAPEAVHA